MHFIYDLNFNVSLKFVKENDYVNKLINRLEYKNSITKSQIEKIRECTLKYIEKSSNQQPHQEKYTRSPSPMKIKKLMQ